MLHPIKQEAYGRELEAGREVTQQREQAMEEPKRPEPPGEYGLFMVISLTTRFGLDSDCEAGRRRYKKGTRGSEVFLRPEQTRSLLGHPVPTVNQKSLVSEKSALIAGKDMGGRICPRGRTLRRLRPDAMSESLHHAVGSGRSQLLSGWR